MHVCVYTHRHALLNVSINQILHKIFVNQHFYFYISLKDFYKNSAENFNRCNFYNLLL